MSYQMMSLVIYDTLECLLFVSDTLLLNMSMMQTNETMYCKNNYFPYDQTNEYSMVINLYH